ncbi:MAG: alpha-mannosidase, partial [Alistipes onderdonkii]|nr:alpha-mannosidase [Alistipes onderdonkii]
FSQDRVRAYLVSNAHFDSQWNWDVQRSIREYIPKTLDQNLFLLDAYPDYVFNFEGGIKYQWMKEYYPHQYELIKRYIREGRWHVTGSTWDATDPNIPSAESFTRNILYGQHFYRREFGVEGTDIFLPDCFGFGWTLPTIAAHSGLIGFSTQKLMWRHRPFHGTSKIPFEIGLWQGVDGSRIMAVMDAHNYTTKWRYEDLSHSKYLQDIAQSNPLNAVYHYYGTGDTGGAPTIESVRALELGLQGDGPVEIISATSDRLYKDYLPYSSHPELPVWNGELLMDVHATGCYTSQAAMKLYNRRNEQLADAAERSAVIADWMGAVPYPKEALNDAWKRFLWHQFHDDLTGTSIWEAYTYSWNDEFLAQGQFCDVILASAGAAASVMDTRAKGSPVLVYNPAAYSRRSLVEATVDLPAEAEGVAVYAPDGKAVPAQIVARDGARATVLFAAAMEPVSYAVYDVRAGKAGKGKVLRASGNTLENRVYKVTLDANGDIASVIDKRNGRDLVEKGKAFRLAVLTPNVSNRYPAWEIHKATLDQTPEPVDTDVRISVAECGAARASLKVERRYGDSRLVQYIRLTDGGDDERIDIVADIDWKTPDALLKAEFPMSVSAEEAVYDIGIGNQRRPTNHQRAHETFAHHWADLSDGDYGIAVLNDSKYGWDKPADNTLRLSLLHTPSTEKRYADQRDLDFGRHTMTYSLVGHDGDHNRAGVVEKGELLNQPLLSFTTPKHPGKLGRRFSFVAASTPQIAVKALKKAEDGSGYIVRVFETTGREVRGAELAFPVRIVSAEEVNGIEEPVGEARFEGNRLLVDAGHFAPKTYKVTLAEAPVAAPAIENAFVDFPVNQNSISSDPFKSVAKVDKECNSYAAELMPEVIVHGGIEYRRGEPDVKNVLNCRESVTVDLPQGDYNKVYILASSSRGDRKAVFDIDGRKYEAVVPYYSGFRAQWAWADKTKSFVKDGTIAHIGNHRHKMNGRNDAYTFTYLYRLGFDIAPGAGKLTLPEDADINIFAITVSGNRIDGTRWACEPRALPVIE